MKMTVGLLLLAVAGLVADGSAAVANATPCTASGLASTVSSVTGAAAQYLDTHPDANDALTQAGSQSPEDAKASLRAYFTGHTDQYFALKDITQPLTDMRAQYNSAIGPGQIAALLQAFSE